MRLLLIDGLNLIRRVYAAVPGVPGTPGHDEGALQSIARSVLRALDETRATHAVCVMDSPEQGWRQKLYPKYKSSRPSMPEALAALLSQVAAALRVHSVPSVAVPQYEADDVLASIVHRVAAVTGIEAIVLSTDKSMLSLLPLGARVRHHFEHRDLDSAYVMNRYAVPAELLLDWMALVGDKGQDVPGAQGIGRKSASALLNAYANLDAVLAADAKVDRENARLLRLVQRDAEAVRLSRALVSLKTDANAGINLRDCRVIRPKR